MSRLKSLARIGVVAVTVALGVMSGEACAGLVSADLFAAGDGLLTRDSATSLDWLDLNQTTGLSVNQILANVGGWASLGFVHASTAQVATLFTDAGIPNVNQIANNGFSIANFAPASALQALLGGPTGNLSFPDVLGFAGAGLVNTANVQLDPSGVFGGGLPTARVTSPQSILGATPQSVTFANVAIGNWLIRSSPVPAPEPGTLAVLGIGLAGLGWLRRRTAG